MSVYRGDNPRFLELSIDSMLNQSCEFEVLLYIAVDGEVDKSLSSVLNKYASKKSIFIFWFDKNEGLAKRLNFLIDSVVDDPEIKYILRMDADDICFSTRLSKQIDYLEKNKKIDVLGTSVVEIDEHEIEISKKLMDVRDFDLKKNIIKRCPFNHPTVAFRRNIFDDGNRYDDHLSNTQDYYLWIVLSKKGYVFSNLREPLLYFRISKTFYKRRGYKKAINDFSAKLFAIKQLKRWSLMNIVYAISILILRLSPEFFQKIAYKKFRKGIVRI
jgi:hypothetical protein